MSLAAGRNATSVPGCMEECLPLQTHTEQRHWPSLLDCSLPPVWTPLSACSSLPIKAGTSASPLHPQASASCQLTRGWPPWAGRRCTASCGRRRRSTKTRRPASTSCASTLWSPGTAVRRQPGTPAAASHGKEITMGRVPRAVACASACLCFPLAASFGRTGSACWARLICRPAVPTPARARIPVQAPALAATLRFYSHFAKTDMHPFRATALAETPRYDSHFVQGRPAHSNRKIGGRRQLKVPACACCRSDDLATDGSPSAQPAPTHPCLLLPCVRMCGCS